MKRLLNLVLFPALAAALLSGGSCADRPAGSDHAGAGGQEHSGGDGHADHEEGEHADEGDHDEHGEEEGHAGDVVHLSPEQLDRAGVVIEPLGGGTITTSITLPAEIGLNLDAVVHLTPRVPGIVRSVGGLLGHEVRAGEVLAVLESAELGEAKIDYLRAVRGEAIAAAELARERTISTNTEKLLDILRAEPDPEALRTATAGLTIGQSKGRLISAYARVRAAEANDARERELYAQNLSTEPDLLVAQEAFNSAKADYQAAFEEIDLGHGLRLKEAERAAGFASSVVENVRRRLHLMGLDDAAIAGIEGEPGDAFALYTLTAPIDGRIVAKHIAPGERIGTDTSVYTIADLGTVWLNISVYSHYAGEIAGGQRVVVEAAGKATTGVVDYVSAVVDEATRTVSARVVIDNADRSWRPGSFVTARVETGAADAARVVPIDAVQTFEGRPVVFVREEGGIVPVPVNLGRRNERVVELLGDEIPLGTPFVASNSFLMKSELGKSAAGHQH